MIPILSMGIKWIKVSGSTVHSQMSGFKPQFFIPQYVGIEMRSTPPF